MSKELEIEFKNMLTQEEFQLLVDKYFLNTPAFSQTNCYFDTSKNELKEKSMGLRLRKRDGKNECTLKIPTADEHTYQEVTDNLTNHQMEQLIKNRQIFKDGDVGLTLQQLGISIENLHIIGALTTYRREKRINNTTLLVLDESHFGQTTDFELEMEVQHSDKGEMFFNDFLIKEGIKRRPASKKIARMIKYLS
ncbi:CYTH domain-containing protein [Vagococcus sp. JNUCC 83]